jgi:hypothetical protein
MKIIFDYCRFIKPRHNEHYVPGEIAGFWNYLMYQVKDASLPPNTLMYVLQ